MYRGIFSALLAGQEVQDVKGWFLKHEKNK